MNDLVSRQAILALPRRITRTLGGVIVEESVDIEDIKKLPPAQPEIIHCRDCKHQIKNFYEDKRRKDGGYYVYGCELSNDYSHVCLDDDFCSRAERREE